MRIERVPHEKAARVWLGAYEFEKKVFRASICVTRTISPFAL
jgi:hypothetical protein